MGMILAIFIGGGLGSISRYGVYKLVEQFWSGRFPLGTFVANLLSCVVMGVVVAFFYNKITSIEMKALILIGFCGGFSTFSTFSRETLTLMESGNYIIAFLNIMVSLVFCMAILWFFTNRSV